MQDRRFSVNGKVHGGKADISLPDRQQQAGKTVAAIMDQINQLLSETEKKLKAASATDDAAVIFDVESPDNSEWESRRVLGFRKCESVWRLCYLECEESVVSDEYRTYSGWMPLADCTRRIRAYVASRFPELLPKLHEKIVKDTEDFVSTANDALAAHANGPEATVTLNQTTSPETQRGQGRVSLGLVSFWPVANRWRSTMEDGGVRLGQGTLVAAYPSGKRVEDRGQLYFGKLPNMDEAAPVVLPDAKPDSVLVLDPRAIVTVDGVIRYHPRAFANQLAAWAKEWLAQNPEWAKVASFGSARRLGENAVFCV